MNTIHAWFSMGTALRTGSSVYRTPAGDQLNVTRVDVSKDTKGKFPDDENYLGPVLAQDAGGEVRGVERASGITASLRSH